MLSLMLGIVIAFLAIRNSYGFAKVYQHFSDDVPECLASDGALHPFVNISNLYYYLEGKEKVNWFEASNKCRKLGSHLAVIDTAEQMKAISDYLTVKRYTHSNWIWIGATDLANEGVFTWENTGENLNFSRWSHSQPDNADGHENCVHLWRPSGEWTFNDLNCKRQAIYLCQLNELKTITTTIW